MFEIILNSILPNILEIVTTIISITVAYYVVPYIKSDLIPWLKEKHLYGMIKSFVQAVEKLSESGVIKKDNKKSMVIQLLESKGIVVDATVGAFIESCVKELDIVTSAAYGKIMETKENN